MVCEIGDVEVACAIHHHASGLVQLGLDRRAAVPAESPLSRARNGGDRPRGIDLANAVVVLIGDVEVARPVHRHASGQEERRLDRRAAVSAEASLFRARDGGDRPGAIDPADAVVVSIGDIEVARPVHRHAIGIVETRLSCRAAIPAEPLLSRARNGGDRPGGIHLADAVVVGIGDVEVACAVHRHAIGQVETRLSCRAAVLAEPTTTRNGGDRPDGIDLADAAVVAIGDVEVARAVHRHAIGIVETRLSCRAAIPAETVLPRSRNGGDRPGGIDPADAVVVAIGDVEVARGIYRHVIGEVETRRNRRAAVPGETAD